MQLSSNLGLRRRTARKEKMIATQKGDSSRRSFHRAKEPINFEKLSSIKLKLK